MVVSEAWNLWAVDVVAVPTRVSGLFRPNDQTSCTEIPSDLRQQDQNSMVYLQQALVHTARSSSWWNGDGCDGVDGLRAAGDAKKQMRRRVD
jgi:hypothetical protein